MATLIINHKKPKLLYNYKETWLDFCNISFAITFIRQRPTSTIVLQINVFLESIPLYRKFPTCRFTNIFSLCIRHFEFCTFLYIECFSFVSIWKFELNICYIIVFELAIFLNKWLSLFFRIINNSPAICH